MEKYYSIETAVRLAVEEAQRKDKLGLLASSGEDFRSTPMGDTETIYSLASCYGQFVENDSEGRDAIEDKLLELYPNLV